MSYYNTTKETGAKLREYRHKAGTQDHLILNFLKHHKHSSYTPREINKRFKFKDWDINGVRRCLSTWTNGYEGKPRLLVKTSEKRNGPKGRPEYTWKFKSPTK